MIDLAGSRTPWLAGVAVAAAAATWLGGALALRAGGRIRLILGFSAGAVIAVALADLLPEALELHPDPATTAAWMLGAFAAYMVLDRGLQALTGGRSGHRGQLGAASLTGHSLVDGLGVGLAFQVSAPTGLVLAIAVLAHDVADGINTVSLGLQTPGGPRTARRWLLADAFAPAVGIALSLLIRVQAQTLGVLLAAFAGVFLYIGASELLPESHERHPHPWTTAAALIGMGVIFVAVKLARG